MGPSCGRRKISKSSSRRKSLSKDQSKNSKIQEKSWVLLDKSPVKPSDNEPCKKKNIDNFDMELSSDSSACSTPKAEKFRIPEIITCPPAPKKRRLVTSSPLRRTSITFYDPPDIEVFFNPTLCGGRV